MLRKTLRHDILDTCLHSPVGQPVRVLVTGATPTAAELLRCAAELVAAQFATVAAAAEGCDAPVATDVRPAGVRL